MTFPLPPVTRTVVRNGIAAYFGGSYVGNIRAYQNGPLLSYGLSTVRSGWGKRLDLDNFIKGQVPGRGMGAYMIVEVKQDKEWRRANAGAPVRDGSGNIIAGGIKFVQYRIRLNIFHLAQKDYAEDAQADIDQLIEAIKQYIRVDRTLGMDGVITDAGETPFGIQTREGMPGVDGNDRTATWTEMQFEVRTQIIA